MHVALRAFVSTARVASLGHLPGRVAQLARALPLQGRCRGFESLRAHNSKPQCSRHLRALSPALPNSARTPAGGRWEAGLLAGGPLTRARSGTPGRLAGLFDGIDVTTTSVAINSGDSIVFYTDGATDVAPPHGLTPTQFEELVRAAASGRPDTEQTADRLEKSLSSILPIADRRDDIAILVVQSARSRLAAPGHGAGPYAGIT